MANTNQVTCKYETRQSKERVSIQLPSGCTAEKLSKVDTRNITKSDLQKVEAESIEEHTAKIDGCTVEVDECTAKADEHTTRIGDLLRDFSFGHDTELEADHSVSQSKQTSRGSAAPTHSLERRRRTATPLKDKRTSVPTTTRPITESMQTSATPTARRAVRLFIASLGNPPPYHSTRHSAGHVLLKSLQSHLALPSLTKSKQYAGGHISLGSDVDNPAWTLFQCPTQMNISGTAVMKAYKQFQADVRNAERGSGESIVDALVVLHDEMEIAPATFKIRRGNLSAKGHNGIKSVQSSLQSAGMFSDMSRKGNERLVKIGVGIGRPEGKTRERDAVSAYVLGQLTREEREGIESMTGRVIETLASEIERLSLGK